MDLLYLFNEKVPSCFQSPQRESGQGGEMSVAPGNSTLSTPRNWSYWGTLACCTVMNWQDTSKCCGQVIIKQWCKVKIVQVQMFAF